MALANMLACEKNREGKSGVLQGLPPFHTISMVKMPDVIPKYTGMESRPQRTECFRLRTPNFVIRKMTAAKPPAMPGAMNQEAMTWATPFLFQLQDTPF